jgi:hypothetical protein
MAAMIAVAAGVIFYQRGVDVETRPADLWVASFLARIARSVGVLTRVPGVVFLRLTDDRSLNDYGARFFL